MGLLAFILRAIFVLFFVRLLGIVLRAFFGGFVQGSRSGPSTGRAPGPRPGEPAPRGQIEDLVKDPVCGVHTARSSAIAGRYEGRDAYFCSEECAAKAATAARG